MLALTLGIAISIQKCPGEDENLGMSLPGRSAEQLTIEDLGTPDLFFAMLIVLVGSKVSKPFIRSSLASARAVVVNGERPEV